MIYDLNEDVGSNKLAAESTEPSTVLNQPTVQSEKPAQTFVHVELQDGLPVIVDGENYSDEELLNSLKEVAPNIKWSDLQRGQFVKKISAAFGFATNVICSTLEEVIEDAERLIENEKVNGTDVLSSENKFGELDSFNETNEFELNEFEEEDSDDGDEV